MALYVGNAKAQHRHVKFERTCEMKIQLVEFGPSDKCLNFRASQVSLNLLLGCTVFSNQEDTSDLAFDTNVYTQS